MLAVVVVPDGRSESKQPLQHPGDHALMGRSTWRSRSSRPFVPPEYPRTCRSMALPMSTMPSTSDSRRSICRSKVRRASLGVATAPVLSTDRRVPTLEGLRRCRPELSGRMRDPPYPDTPSRSQRSVCPDWPGGSQEGDPHGTRLESPPTPAPAVRPPRLSRQTPRPTRIRLIGSSCRPQRHGSWPLQK